MKIKILQNTTSSYFFDCTEKGFIKRGFKKYLAFLIILCFSQMAEAQPSLTQQSNGFKAGSYILQSAKAFNFTKVGGANAVWDYSGLVNDSTCNETKCVPSIDTFVIAPIKPGSSINKLFPQATLYVTNATHNSIANYYDAISANSSADIVYGAIDSVFYGQYYVDTTYNTPPAKVLFFPFTYGSKAVSSYTSTETQHGLGANGPYIYAEVDSFFADAYGTLKLPGKTYTNVLRVLDRSTYSDMTGTSITYDFWASGYAYPVLEVDLDQTNTVDYVSYLKSYSTALPLTLLSFTAQMQHSNALLQWQTAEEINTKSFIIERSAGTTNFIPLGSVTAANTSGVNNYSYTDTKPLGGVNYYRLKMVDQDGAITYSSIVNINNSNINFAVKVYPNPAGSNATLSLTTALQGKYNITVADLAGKTIKRINSFANLGTNTMQLDLQGLAGGVYIITINDANGVHTTKLVKQ